MRRDFPLPSFLICLLACFCAAATVARAGGGKPDHAISFHAEAQPLEGANRTFMFPVNGDEKHFLMAPEITHHSFAGFVPFRADDGTYGAAFVLDRRAAIKLDQWTTSRQGSLIAACIDMRAVDYMVVDRPIKDGVLVLWRGLEAGHIEFLQKKLKLPVMNKPDALRDR